MAEENRPNPISFFKNHGVGIAIVAFILILIATAGYAIYFALTQFPNGNGNKDQVSNVTREKSAQEEEKAAEPDFSSFGITTQEPEVAGKSIQKEQDYEGFSNAETFDGVPTTKGGQPASSGSVQGTSDSSGETSQGIVEPVIVSAKPEIEINKNHITYIYRVNFSKEVLQNYNNEEFDYDIKPQNCNSSKYFLNRDYNLENDANLKASANIIVKIKDRYLNNYNNLQKSSYRIRVNGDSYTGTTYVPVCAN